MCEADTSLKTLLLHHKDCDGHITPDGHLRVPTESCHFGSNWKLGSNEERCSVRGC